jgi:hypothetical protein
LKTKNIDLVEESFRDSGNKFSRETLVKFLANGSLTGSEIKRKLSKNEGFLSKEDPKINLIINDAIIEAKKLTAPA